MILIRADGNGRIGSGHLMRCMTIADALLEKEEVLFVTASQESVGLIEKRGFAAFYLQGHLSELLEVVQRYQPRLILIDSYEVSDKELAETAKLAPVVYLDDFGQTVYPVDFIINYNVFADKEAYAQLYQGKNTQCLTGPSYIPIRPAFTQETYHVRDEMKNVLLLTGGGDYYGLAEKFLEHFGKQTELLGITFHLVCGYYNGHAQELRKKAENCKNFRIYENLQEIWKLMHTCDLAVTAGGTTVYELCAMGVPLLGYSFADNQQSVLHFLQENKIAPYCGDYRTLKEQLFAKLTEYMISYKDLAVRRQTYTKEKELVDGQGAKRIAEALLKCYNVREH